jgi:hydrogenase-4 component J
MEPAIPSAAVVWIAANKLDCFTAKLEIPIDGYRGWLSHLPRGEARRKLEGLLRFGEIEITAGHTRPLREAFDATMGDMSTTEADWTTQVDKMLQAIDEEPAIYLMVRLSR